MDYLLEKKDLREINLTLDKIFSNINNKYKHLDKLSILEVGIGNGNKSIPIAKKYKFKKYYGLEPLKKIYDVFIESSKMHNSKIISYNMDLNEFVTKIKIKFDIILLINVIHFIGLEKLLETINPMLIPGGFVIIQNPHAKPSGWGNKQFVADSINYDEKKWLKFKSQLDKCYSDLSNSKYLHKIETDNKYIFFILNIK